MRSVTYGNKKHLSFLNETANQTLKIIYCRIQILHCICNESFFSNFSRDLKLEKKPFSKQKVTEFLNAVFYNSCFSENKSRFFNLNEKNKKK